MGNILFYILVLFILAYYPEVFLLAGLILGGVWLISKYELVEKDKADADEVDDEPTPQERAEKEVEAKMKPGFRNDPEWKAASKKINDRAVIMREISDLEIEIDRLEEELKEECDPFTANLLKEAKDRLKTLENRAGITQRRAERTKEEKIVLETPQATPIDMTDQEIDAALQELNDS